MSSVLYSNHTFAEQIQSNQSDRVSHQTLQAKHGVGNGGDFVRSFFITTGYEVMNYLFQTEEGQAIVSDFNINVYAFQNILSTRVILTSNDPLTDVFGNQVDAIYSGGHLYLHTEAWERFLTSERNVHVMVFHEMLRATGHYDDDYIISRRLVITDDFTSPGAGEDNTTPLPPNVDAGFVLCKCNTVNVNGNTRYELMCKNIVTNEVILDSWLYENLRTCESEKNRVLTYYGQTPEKPSDPKDNWDSIAAHSAKSQSQHIQNETDISFTVEGYSQEFSLKCNFIKKSRMYGPNGGSWRISSGINNDICYRINTALLSSSESNPVTIYLHEGWIKGFKFDL